MSEPGRCDLCDVWFGHYAFNPTETRTRCENCQRAYQAVAAETQKTLTGILSQDRDAYPIKQDIFDFAWDRFEVAEKGAATMLELVALIDAVYQAGVAAARSERLAGHSDSQYDLRRPHK